MNIKSVFPSALVLALAVLLVACGEAPAPSQPCAMIMATFYGSDPSSPVAPLQSKLKTDLDSAGVNVSDLKVEGVGERCVGGGSSSRDICCMSTPINISLQAGDLKDREALGSLLGRTLKMIYGAEDYRGGSINVTFVSPKGESPLTFDSSKGLEALEHGLDGAALLDAIATPAYTPTVSAP